MLGNFQLTAIVKTGSRTVLLRIPLLQALQRTLSMSWQAQYDAFVGGVQEIPFNAGYQPEEHERFSLSSYNLPGWLVNETSQTISDLDAINSDDSCIDSIKGVVAFARSGAEGEVVLFQRFSRSHVIRPGRSLFLANGTYETTERPGLTLEAKLSAVYLRGSERLLFHNFRTVNAFLPLADFYEEASEEQIREVLTHKLLAAEDADALAKSSNQWFRRRFAMLRDSGVLDRCSAKQIQERARGYGVDVRLSNGKVVFPTDRSLAHIPLPFLNEEIFRGSITDTLYETNSKREAD